MVQFFTLVLNGITSFLLWFSKFTTFSNSASMLSNIRLASRKVLYVGLIVAIIAYIVILIAFFYFMIDSIVSAYNLISAFLEKMQNMQTSASASPILQPLYLLLNSTGFVQGFNAAFPFIASALTFRLLKILYNVILNVHWKLLNFYRVTIDGITAA
ncbi:MAG: hypothetical protein AB1763_08700 [Campylobacterota bacterium]